MQHPDGVGASAFIRVAPDVVRRLDQERADRTDFPGNRPRDRAVGSPHRRPAVRNGRRVAAERQLGRGLARELRLALQYPEGAAV